MHIVVTRVDITVTVSTVCRKILKLFFPRSICFFFSREIRPVTEHDKGDDAQVPITTLCVSFWMPNSVYLVFRMTFMFQYLGRHARSRIYSNSLDFLFFGCVLFRSFYWWHDSRVVRNLCKNYSECSMHTYGIRPQIIIKIVIIGNVSWGRCESSNGNNNKTNYWLNQYWHRLRFVILWLHIHSNKRKPLLTHTHIHLHITHIVPMMRVAPNQSHSEGK